MISDPDAQCSGNVPVAAFEPFARNEATSTCTHIRLRRTPPGPTFSVDNDIAVSEQEAYQDITMAVDSELPVVLKAYFYLSAASTATAASVSLDVSYSDGGAEEGVGLVDFGASSGDGTSGAWTQGIAAVYPTQIVRSARVRQK